ncbi:hypothetical protein AB0C77_00410 [Streptomyces sp. NPDC048629]|uniref:hypothetical protein n=1 Tax=Streptomyces sp. NPDC048629 TaxID=3154824 RepID=UPI0034335DF3
MMNPHRFRDEFIGSVGVEIDCFLGGGDCVDANHEAQLAFGDLADGGVVEDELGAERGVGAETGKRLVKVLLARFGVLAALERVSGCRRLHGRGRPGGVHE